ncbi:MAG: ATP-binding protein [Cytophagales bacterium]
MKATDKLFQVSIIFSIFFSASGSRISDSLNATIPLKNDTSKVKHCLAIYKNLEDDDLVNKRKYAQKALEIADQINFPFGRAKSFEYLASVMYQENKIVQSLEYYFRAIDIYNQSNLGYYGVNALVKIGTIFHHFSDIETAKTYAKFASQKLFIHPNIIGAKEDICALMALQLKLKLRIETQATIKNYNKYFLSQATENADFYVQESNYFLEINDFNKAVESAKKAVNFYSSANQTTSAGYLLCMENLGNICMAAGKYTLANEYLLKCLEVSKSNKSNYWEAQAYKSLANLFLTQNKSKEAIGFARSYCALADISGNQYVVKNAQLLLSKAYANHNEYLDAYLSIVKYKNTSDSLTKIENGIIINSLIYKRGLAESEYLNTKLLQENKKKDLIIRDKQILQFGLIIGTLIIFIFAIFAIFLFIRYRINNNLLKSKTEEIISQNEMLELQNTMLGKLNSDKNGLIGVVSHDLKAPLNRIEGLLAMVLLDGTCNKEQTMYLSVAQKELNDAKEMIKKILDTELKNADATKLKIEKINLIEFLDEIIDNYQIVASNKDIDIIKEFNDYEVDILTDRNYLSRIIDNLLSNAIKFSENNKKIYVIVVREIDKIEISIRDEGPGFTDNDKQNIFKKYQKLSAQPTRGENSTGLGLHIVQMLMQELQGKIELESEYGKGASFKLTFKK